MDGAVGRRASRGLVCTKGWSLYKKKERKEEKSRMVEASRRREEHVHPAFGSEAYIVGTHTS